MIRRSDVEAPIELVPGEYDAWEVLQIAQAHAGQALAWALDDEGGFVATGRTVGTALAPTAHELFRLEVSLASIERVKARLRDLGDEAGDTPAPTVPATSVEAAASIYEWSELYTDLCAKVAAIEKERLGR
jgi:hypothetical protein